MHRILRRCHVAVANLPFHPMALGSYAALVAQTEEVNNTSGLYFVSPKHDGIRVVSYAVEGKTTPASITCFSRFGRPLRGLFWIEDELQTLRSLSRDMSLCVDGELYIHPKLLPSGGGGERSEHAVYGFQEVCGLITRLRGGAPSQLPKTTSEVLRLVPELPHYCVFDVVTYTPPSLARAEAHGTLHDAMTLCNVSNLAQMTVSPGRTPFLQRLRTLSFLFTLLQMQHTAANGKSDELAAADRPRFSNLLEYKGGKYIHLIPYERIQSVADGGQYALHKFHKLGYEGVVLRTAMNPYSATVKVGKKAALSGALRAAAKNTDKKLPNRSNTAVKLLPFFEDEFVVLGVVLKALPGEKCTSQKSFWGLRCATKGGVVFQVQLPGRMDHLERKELLQAMIPRGRPVSSTTALVGLFATIQFPSLVHHGVPRFPKLKGIRGGKGWYL